MQHSLHGLLDPDKEAVDGDEDCDQIAQLAGDSCTYKVGIFSLLTWILKVTSKLRDSHCFTHFCAEIQTKTPQLAD